MKGYLSFHFLLFYSKIIDRIIGRYFCILVRSIGESNGNKIYSELKTEIENLITGIVTDFQKSATTYLPLPDSLLSGHCAEFVFFFDFVTRKVGSFLIGDFLEICDNNKNVFENRDDLVFFRPGFFVKLKFPDNNQRKNNKIFRKKIKNQTLESSDVEFGFIESLIPETKSSPFANKSISFFDNNSKYLSKDFWGDKITSSFLSLILNEQSQIPLLSEISPEQAIDSLIYKNKELSIELNYSRVLYRLTKINKDKNCKEKLFLQKSSEFDVSKNKEKLDKMEESLTTRIFSPDINQNYSYLFEPCGNIKESGYFSLDYTKFLLSYFAELMLECRENQSDKLSKRLLEAKWIISAGDTPVFEPVSLCIFFFEIYNNISVKDFKRWKMFKMESERLKRKNERLL